MPEDLQTLRSLYEETKEKDLQEFFTFLQFQSVSSETEHTKEVLKCADWLTEKIKRMGFHTELWETSGHPVIFASYDQAGSDKPTLLIYNHYDVQPVDPIELWDSAPFEPTLRDGEVFARGAQDNKGQCFYVLQALKLLLKRDGSLPINVKLCIEGEEETGSAGLSEVTKTKRKELQADYLALVDAGIRGPGKPAITLGLRGIVTMEVEVEGSSTDLHSGMHGGVVYNPIHALVEMLAKLRDKDGKVAIPGFYDDVVPLAEAEKKQLSFEFDTAEYKTTFGAEPTGGEKELPPLERAWLRPTLEVNGIYGGYTGSGFKTVIPAKAHAKVSCRLVENQDPMKIGNLVAKHISSLAPAGIRTTVKINPGVGKAIRSEGDSVIVRAFSKAYEEVFGKKTEFIGMGGSIPIVNELGQASGADVVLVGLGLPSDRIHAPNEHFGIDRLEKGALIIARALEILAG